MWDREHIEGVLLLLLRFFSSGSHTMTHHMYSRQINRARSGPEQNHPRSTEERQDAPVRRATTTPSTIADDVVTIDIDIQHGITTAHAGLIRPLIDARSGRR